jgi:hypothetical protein
MHFRRTVLLHLLLAVVPDVAAGGAGTSCFANFHRLFCRESECWLLPTNSYVSIIAKLPVSWKARSAGLSFLLRLERAVASSASRRGRAPGRDARDDLVASTALFAIALAIALAFLAEFILMLAAPAQALAITVTAPLRL